MRAHLIVSPEPLKRNQTLTALCEKDIPNAQFVFMFEQHFDEALSLSTLLCCHKCLALFLERPSTYYGYIYGTIPGQVALTGENGPTA